VRKTLLAVRIVRVSALLLAALAPLFVVAHVNARLAERYGTAVGRGLAQAAADVLPARTSGAMDATFFADVEASSLAASPAATPGQGSAKRPGKAPKGAKAPKKRGVFVSAATVLKLAEGRAMPRAVPAAASGARPAGLRLVGVGGLGIGMRDGDVLTRVLGGGVGSVGDVVARVIAARGRRAPEISAEFWRDGEAWSLVVEQPYLNPVVQP
jgi:hypothetical protein